jgi:hypothetical protein
MAAAIIIICGSPTSITIIIAGCVVWLLARCLFTVMGYLPVLFEIGGS